VGRDIGLGGRRSDLVVHDIGLAGSKRGLAVHNTGQVCPIQTHDWTWLFNKEHSTNGIYNLEKSWTYTMEQN